MERAAGRDLGQFFQQWLYRGGIPRLEGTWQWDATTKQLVVDLRQEQEGEPFSIPIEFGVVEGNGPPRVERAALTARSGRFTFRADREPASVVLDPNVRLLAALRLTRQ